MSALGNAIHSSRQRRTTLVVIGSVAAFVGLNLVFSDRPQK